MKEQIEQIRKNAISEVEKATDLRQLEEIRVKYSGKKSELTVASREISTLPKSERPVMGGLINQVKKEIEQLIKEKEKALAKEELTKKLETEKIDITLPSIKVKRGSKHPLTRITEEVVYMYLWDIMLYLDQN